MQQKLILLKKLKNTESAQLCLDSSLSHISDKIRKVGTKMWKKIGMSASIRQV